MSNKDMSEKLINNLKQLIQITNFASIGFCVAILFSLNCNAEVYFPEKNQIVASWDTSQSLENALIDLKNIEWHLQQSQYSGSSNVHLRQASMMLTKLSDSETAKPEFWYYKARVFEHQHQFTEALHALDNAIELDKKYVSAWLMKSNVFLLLGQINQAKSSCIKLVGLANVDIALACMLQTATGTEQLNVAYEKLQSIVARIQHDATNIDSTKLWLVQLAADLASQLSLKKQAAKWMNTYPLEKTPISYMSQWADAQLALGQYGYVLNKLGEIVQQAEYQDDALLMRLAIAEVHQNQTITNGNNYLTKWQLAVNKRVNLRLQRNDIYHAADLTRFFLYVQPDPEKAKYWAQQNLIQSKSHEDHTLVAAVQTMKMER